MRFHIRSVKRVVILVQMAIILYFIGEEFLYSYGTLEPHNLPPSSIRPPEAQPIGDGGEAAASPPPPPPPPAPDAQAPAVSPPAENQAVPPADSAQPAAAETPSLAAAGALPPPINTPAAQPPVAVAQPPVAAAAPPPPAAVAPDAYAAPAAPPVSDPYAAAAQAPGAVASAGVPPIRPTHQPVHVEGYGIEDPFPGWTVDVGDIPEEERNYMRVRYTPPPITEIAYPGHKLKVQTEYGREVAELTNHLVKLTPDTLENFVFVTAASSNHFEESRDAVASAQNQFPGKPILFFDLGLEPAEIEELKKWESVEYRWFNFTKYPGQFLVNLRRCAWKPFIIAEALQQYGGVFYMDTSIRIMSHDLGPAFRLATFNGGFVQFHASKYSIYGGTHEKLYTYFPTKKPMMKNMAMTAGGALLVYNTEEVYRNIMWYWMMCTLDKQCYIPTLEMNCDMHTYDKWKDYMHCHKFDTSIINVLLGNFHGYDANKYLAPDGLITIEKMPTTHFRTKYKS